MKNKFKDSETLKPDSEISQFKEDADFDKEWNIWSTAKFDTDQDQNKNQNEESIKPSNSDIPENLLTGCRKVETDSKESNFFKRVSCNNCVFRDTCEITRVDNKLQLEDSCFIGLSPEQSESALFEIDKKNFEDINLRLRVKNAHIDMLNRCNKDLQAENEQLKSENKQLKSDKENLNNRVMDLAFENVDLEGRIEGAEKVEAKNAELMLEIDRISNSPIQKTLEKQLRATDKVCIENEELKQEVERLDHLFNSYLQENRELNEKIESKNETLTILSDELDSKSIENKFLKDNIEKLSKRIDSLNKAVENLKVKLENTRGLVDRQAKTINTLVDTNSSLTSNVLNIKDN